MWERRRRVLAFMAATYAFGLGEESARATTCEGDAPACACLYAGFGDTVVSGTVLEVDEAERRVVLEVDGTERAIGTIRAVTGLRVTGTYQSFEPSRAYEHESCEGAPPVVGERVVAGFDSETSGFSCPGCIKDMDCDAYCPLRGAEGTLHTYFGIRLLPFADTYDLGGTSLSRPAVIGMTQLDCSMIFPSKPAPDCGYYDTVFEHGNDDGCSVAPTGRPPARSLAWLVVVGVAALRRIRRRAQRT